MIFWPAKSEWSRAMIERRKRLRARTCLGGTIAFNRRKSTMDCHVRNLSPAGARVAFTNAAAVPDQFDLTIARKERSFKARMVWRGVNEAGVAFLGEYDQAVPIPLEWAKQLRECEAKKAALRRRIAQLTDSSA
jgi:PilZ domain